MPVQFAEDRTMVVQPDQVVRVEWVPIEKCTPGPGRMSPEAVEKKYRRLLQQGHAACWPPLVGEWHGDVMRICDGRHELLASLMLGRSEVLVALLADREIA